MLNTAHSSGRDVYYNRDRPSITSLIPEGPHVILDLGCGAGAVGRSLLAKKKASKMVGVELFASAAKEASEHYSQVHVGDIETMSLPYEKCFDYVLCGDILEHLKDPYSVVKRVNDWLKDDGHFICSLPNIRYWRILKDLIFRGAWEYREAGIMDKTHLRFFTRRSCVTMLSEGGFAVEQYRMLMTGRRFKLMNAVTLGIFDEFLAPQVVLLSRKQSSANGVLRERNSQP